MDIEKIIELLSKAENVTYGNESKFYKYFKKYWQTNRSVYHDKAKKYYRRMSVAERANVGALGAYVSEFED